MSRRIAFVSLLFALVSFTAPLPAQSSGFSESVVHNFTGTQTALDAGLIMDGAGNLYGTTLGGGTAGNGTVFKLNSSGQQTVLYNFTRANGDGANPYASLILDSAGNLYGTTSGGGPADAGTIFKLDTSGHETVLYAFTGAIGASSDGATPLAALVMDSSSNLYGTTYNGGSSGKGSVFKLDSSGHESLLYSFTGTSGDGANPLSSLIIDSAGNFYGTTFSGGASQQGTVFKLNPGTGQETVLYSFTGTSGDGAFPQAGLLMDSAGNLYGTTISGGSAGVGTVFKLNPSTSQETVLHNFAGGNTDGAEPKASLIMDSTGNLYGTTNTGGTLNEGVVFELNTSTSQETLLHGFNGTLGDGVNPAAALIMDSSGNLYGTTTGGGSAGGGGTIFKLNTSSQESVLYSFALTNGDGSTPDAGLIADSAGNLYGTTYTGGSANVGTVFELNVSTGQEKVLYNFLGGSGDGANPQAGLVMDSAGNLYGTTNNGGPAGDGTIFKLNPSTGQETVLHSFLGSDGAHPHVGLMMDSAGNLYGTTFSGGSVGFGVAFKLNPGTGQETALYSFAGAGGDGANPQSGLVMDKAGNLYGTTSAGGITAASCSSGCGIVFKLNPGTDQEVVVYSFTGTNGDGALPQASLILDSAGNLYGITSNGGSANNGTVFKLNPSTSQETVLYSFTGANGDGALPQTSLILDSAGNLYGTTRSGGGTSGYLCGSNGCGTVFMLNPTTGKETELYTFPSGANGDGDPLSGAAPYGSLIMDGAGNLYGTASIGGTAEGGVAFKLAPVTYSLSPASGGSTSATVTAGQTATYNLQVNPLNGFIGTVSLSCTGAPTAATCTPSPASVTISGSTPLAVAVNVTTTSRAFAPPSATHRTWPMAPQSVVSLSAFLSLFVLILWQTARLGPSSRRRARNLRGALVLGLAVLATACGGAGGSSGNGGGGNGGGGGGTPAGAYTLTVTGTTQQGLSKTLNLTLTVN